MEYINFISFLVDRPTYVIRALCRHELLTPEMAEFFPNIPKYCFDFNQKGGKTENICDTKLIQIAYLSNYSKDLLKKIKSKIPVFENSAELRFNDVFYIFKEDLENLFNLFHEEKNIYWDQLYDNRSIKWEISFLIKYQDILNWKKLQHTNNIIWNFELLYEIKDNFFWDSLPSDLFWDIKEIEIFKDYLIFSRGKSNIIKKNYQSVPSYINYRYVKSKNCPSLSLSHSVNWSRNLIKSFEDYWDWSELSSNENVPWREDIIDEFIEKLDFNKLCSNKNILWDDSLILKYFEKIDWEQLSFNSALDWSESLIERFKEKWFWKPKYNFFWGDEVHELPCLSNNPGIKWTLSMCEKWNENVDFWRIARNSQITFQAIEKFHFLFDRSETIGSTYHRWSDFRESEYEYSTGWENLSNNDLFLLTNENINFLFSKTITLTYSEGNLAWNGKYVTKKFKVLEILKNKSTKGLSINLIANNLTTWAKILIQDEFINEDVLEEIIKLFHNKNLLFRFLEMTNKRFKE